jgi:hypothetical protein
MGHIEVSAHLLHPDRAAEPASDVALGPQDGVVGLGRPARRGPPPLQAPEGRPAVVELGADVLCRKDALGDLFSGLDNPYRAVQSAHRDAADRYRIVRGRADQGDLASLRTVAGDVLRVCRFVVPNTIVDPVSIEVAAASPADAPSAVTVRGWSRMANAGSFRQPTEVVDSDGAVAASFVEAVKTTLAPFGHTASGAGWDLTNVAGEAVARISVRKTGPSTVAQWFFDLDQLDFYILR